MKVNWYDSINSRSCIRGEAVTGLTWQVDVEREEMANLAVHCAELDDATLKEQDSTFSSSHAYP